jgi:hypothetical protein
MIFIIIFSFMLRKNFLIMSVSNVKNHILVAWKIVRQQMYKRKLNQLNLSQKSSFVVSVQLSLLEQVLKIVQSMALTSLNSNVNIVAIFLNGFAGEIHTFVIHVILNKMLEITSQDIPEINYPSVLE